MPALNKHIGKMSGEVTTRIFVHPLTVGDNPNSSAYEPTLRQYAGTGRWLQCVRAEPNRKEIEKKILIFITCFSKKNYTFAAKKIQYDDRKSYYR
jgi:hypothetical protein